MPVCGRRVVLATIYLLLTEGQGRGFCTLHPRSASLHQIAKDSDSGGLVLSGLLNSPDLRES